MDPLRPFLSLVRSLYTGTQSAKAASRSRGATSPGSAAAAPEVAASQSIERRLQSQLSALNASGAWNAQRAREVFVRQVLLHELGETLAGDPAFMDLVMKVSGHLGGDPRVSARLDHLLWELAASG